ncbi:MAG: ribonuclease HI [Kiritimatiellaeota bacterium]|nr:ribonuclease HI [Kiritimatiellota bacterium]
MSHPAHPGKPTHEVTIYADGAASPNPGCGGYGVIILLREGQRRELSGGFSKTTNNRMEILGAIIGLRELKGQPCKVTIYSDSKYVVDMFNGGYAEKWRRAHWTRNKGKDAALNPDLWNELLNLAAQHEVKFIWVRGHGSNQDNTRCDELAVAARCRQNLPMDVGYEKPLLPDHPKQLSLFGD